MCHFRIQCLNQFRLIIRVNIRDAQGKNAFLHVLFWKSPGYLASVAVFHNNNNICPGNVIFSDRLLIVKPCRSCFKPAFEQLFCCPAPVLILAADEKDFHFDKGDVLSNINFSVNGLAASSALCFCNSNAAPPRKGRPPPQLTAHLKSLTKLALTLLKEEA